MSIKKSYPIAGMHCASCAKLIERKLSKVPGVTATMVNYGNEQAFIESKKEINDGTIIKAVESIGYKIVPNQEEEKKKSLKKLKTKVIISSILSAVIMLLTFIPRFSSGIYIQFILATIVQFYIGLEFYQATISGLRNKSVSMDTLVVMGTTAAFSYSLFVILSGHGEVYFDTSAVIITLILVGRFLEAGAKAKTSDSIKKLLNLSPKTARVVRGKKELEIDIDNLLINDLVRIRPGEKIATDGVVVEGESAIDESLVTGESLPVDKMVGEKVIGGTLNTTGTILIKVTKIGSQTLLAQIIRLVADAQGSRAEVQKLADKVSTYFVPGVLVAAALTFVIWLLLGQPGHALTSAIAVLIIACPCAMGLATPTAIMVGIGRGASNGILIKDASSLEALDKVETIVFDKTGTLTIGKPVLTSFIGGKEALLIAGSLEKNSEHPIAKAIVEEAKKQKVEFIKVSNFNSLSGLGVEGVINGNKYFIGKNEAGGVVLRSNGKIIGKFEVSDEIKNDVPFVISQLEERGIVTWMITGDSESKARRVAKVAGINNILAGVTPAQKAGKIEDFESVAFVGDGINDAPALASADVGIAMGTGTDVAIETSGITLLNKDFKSVLSAFNLSRATMKTIRMNLFWAFGYNIVLIPIAALGILNPMLAALAMAASSISVVGNSLRLKKAKI